LDQLLVSETGDVEQADVISGEPVLARSAVDAAKKWKFKPFIKEGKAIKVTANLPLDFTFEDKIMKKGESADHSAITDSTGAGAYPSIPVKADPVVTASTLTAKLPDRVRVSQGVTTGMLIYQVAPVYPPDARRNRVQGRCYCRQLSAKMAIFWICKSYPGQKN